MKRRTFLKTLFGIAAAAPFLKARKPDAPLPPPVVNSSGTFAGVMRDDYPPLKSVMIMSPAQLKAYRSLGYGVT